MKGYKAFNSDLTCLEFQYEIGKTYELPEDKELKMCECGFHFCKNPIDVFGYYPFGGTRVAEVEALGDIFQEGTKFVTNKIRIIKELSNNELLKLIIDKHHNSGDYNSGDYNSGDYNSGSFNSGKFNSGDFNSGYRNSGDYNSGDYNSGSFNGGNRNSGNCNSGSFNSGYRNSGDYNSGDYNSGSFNGGNRNSGFYNSGNRNTGIFNRDEPKMRSFGKECDMTLDEFIGSLSYDFFALCKRIHDKSLIDKDILRIEALPNFDAEIFEKTTGISLAEAVKVKKKADNNQKGGLNES